MRKNSNSSGGSSALDHDGDGIARGGEPRAAPLEATDVRHGEDRALARRERVFDVADPFPLHAGVEFGRG